MYNEEQKKAFIAASYPDEAKHGEIVGVFELFAPYEESWGCDLVKQQIFKLQPAFDEIMGNLSRTKAKTILAVLKKYRKWFLDSNPNAISTGVILLKLNIEDKLRSSMVASNRHLRLVLDEVFDPPEKESQDCIYRVLLWLAFAGLPRDRAVLVTIDEIDFENMQIHHDGKDYEIYKEGLKEFRKLCALDYLVSYHKNPDYEQQRLRIQGTQLLRGVRKTSIDVQTICKAMSKRFMQTNWQLTYENVQVSGLFYEKYEMERIGQKVSFDDETEERLARMTESSEAALKSSRYGIPFKFRDRYKQWKSLYHVAEE